MSTNEKTNLADALSAFDVMARALRDSGVSEPPGMRELRAALGRLFEDSAELHQWVYLAALRAALAGAPALALLAVDSPSGTIGSDGWLQRWEMMRATYDRWEDDPEVARHSHKALRAVASIHKQEAARRTLLARWTEIGLDKGPDVDALDDLDDDALDDLDDLDDDALDDDALDDLDDDDDDDDDALDDDALDDLDDDDDDDLDDLDDDALDDDALDDDALDDDALDGPPTMGATGDTSPGADLTEIGPLKPTI